MNYTNAQLKELYKKLPPKVQEAIFSEDTAKTLQSIGAQNNLHIDQVGVIADETGLVMLGVTPRSRFSAMIQKRASTTPELAAKVAGEIETRVFKPIQDYMKSDSIENDNVDVLPSPEQATPLTPKLPQYSAPAPVSNSAPVLPPPTPPATITPPSESKPSSAPPISTTAQIPQPPSVTPAPQGSGADLSMIGSKLGSVTYGADQKKEGDQQTSTPKSGTYGVDPYREPIN